VHVWTATVLAAFHRQQGQARQAYRRFMRDGLRQGRQARFYETVEQQILGDERFLAEVDRRAGAPRASERLPRRVGFGTLLAAVATLHGVTPRALLAPGRQRTMVPARAMLVWLARAWSGLTTVELGQRLQRDPSMISRLVTAYAAHRDAQREKQIRRAVQPDSP
jgi:chromosomal replication initiation ATPase DnaA